MTNSSRQTLAVRRRSLGSDWSQGDALARPLAAGGDPVLLPGRRHRRGRRDARHPRAPHERGPPSRTPPT